MGTWLVNPDRQTQYFAISKLDEGGFGSVWRGRTDCNQEVAIKVIRPTSNIGRDYASWLSDQQVHLLCLGHRHIVTTIDQFISPEGYLVIVMELGGGSLHSLFAQGYRWSDKDICAIGTQLLSALGEIHAKGIVHRDVTLKNVIWFHGGIFKLCDFGISKQNVLPGDYARTFVGSPSYYPPELVMNRYTTQRSDIYQLGLVLLSLMMGRHPIPSNLSAAQTQQMILQGVPRLSAESLIPTHGISAQILRQMLPRHDFYRYQSAAHAEAEFRAEFTRLQNLGL
jgi:serine/threonine protein kinase